MTPKRKRSPPAATTPLRVSSITTSCTAGARPGFLGSAGHYCLTRSFHVADISSTQSVKFLDLLWSAGLGFLFFADVPTETTLAGGVVIAAATLWVARREHRRDPEDLAP